MIHSRVKLNSNSVLIYSINYTLKLIQTSNIIFFKRNFYYFDITNDHQKRYLVNISTMSFFGKPFHLKSFKYPVTGQLIAMTLVASRFHLCTQQTCEGN